MTRNSDYFITGWAGAQWYCSCSEQGPGFIHYTEKTPNKIQKDNYSWLELSIPGQKGLGPCSCCAWGTPRELLFIFKLQSVYLFVGAHATLEWLFCHVGPGLATALLPTESCRWSSESFICPGHICICFDSLSHSSPVFSLGGKTQYVPGVTPQSCNPSTLGTKAGRLSSSSPAWAT